MPQLRASMEKRPLQRLLMERPCVRVRAAYEHRYVPNSRLPQGSRACYADSKGDTLQCNMR
jgi:hypothetical protein